MTTLQTARFHIDIPLDKLGEITQALRDLGLDFDPVNHMTALSNENILDGILTGADAGPAIDQINDHLANIQHHRRINTPFPGMSPVQQRDFLHLINLHSSWTSDYEPRLMDVNENRLENFLTTNPHL